MTEEKVSAPRDLPFVNALRLIWEFFLARGNIFHFFHRLHQKFGVNMRVQFALPAYLITEPADVRHVLVANPENYEKGGALVTAKLLLGEGLLSSEGPHHRRHRRAMQPMFHRQKIQTFAEIILACANRRAALWRTGEPVDMAAEVTHITASVISTALFSIDLEYEAHELSEAIIQSQECIVRRIGEPFPLPFITASRERRYKDAVRRMDQSLLAIIRARTAPDAPMKNDLLNMLMEIRFEDGGRMDETELRDEVITLFIAGHETSANTLAWALYLLSRNPEAEAALHRELDTVLAGRDPTLADIPNLPYTEGVMWEAMRLFPPVWMLGREPIEADFLPASQVPIDKHTQVLISVWSMHRNPQYFPEPEKFCPERFRDKIGLAQGFLPFGAGLRSCAGEPFAKMEIVLVLATLCQRYKFRLVPGQKVRPGLLLLLRPKKGIYMIPEARTPQAVT